MAELVVIDTDVLIDSGRGEKEAVACLEQRDYRFIKGLHLLAYPEPFATQA